MGFETTIPAFERTKTVHALDGAATLIGIVCHNHVIFREDLEKIGKKGIWEWKY
jgi:hypothetical protein